ncbi:MAG: MarR family transcriptional regulator [Clostridia bacterium]|nr:MarR family transcriptional regulator [Clostridia bacterium]
MPECPLPQGGFYISKIHQISERIFAKKLKQYNIEEINPAQGRILFFLWQHDGISIQEVSRITSLEKSTLTSMLDRLEAAGHIRREPSREDRRKILIRVLNKDSKIKEVYEKVLHEIADLFYQGFKKEETADFENYLKRIFSNLSEFEKEN